MTPKSKDHLIKELVRTASANNKRPLGEVAFFAETGLKKEDLWDAEIRSYGDLCELAGYPRNRMQQQMEPDQLFAPLARLAEELGHFPNHTDREMARRKDRSFPSYEAYRTARNKNGPLPRQLLEWCRTRPEYAGVQQILEEHVFSQSDRVHQPRRLGRVVKGYVYLFRFGGSGRDYKIGRSEVVARRHSQIAKMFPGQLRVVHVIETDDPSGIERYWLQRFEPRRIEGKTEIFRLQPEDLAAFNSRKYQ
jgi:hypothetical protein